MAKPRPAFLTQAATTGCRSMKYAALLLPPDGVGDDIIEMTASRFADFAAGPKIDFAGGEHAIRFASAGGNNPHTCDLPFFAALECGLRISFWFASFLLCQGASVPIHEVDFCAQMASTINALVALTGQYSRSGKRVSKDSEPEAAGGGARIFGCMTTATD